ncbi:hypothetical protein I4F81_001193 [Pyropia yezoensis]|uniref:Uncharacterized protein n=1 Tax=Pyropia yezoensis TaxID=2788 RepID=A0ACC3BLA2_PYRYE|nr:hypothetical protein I4F81_001193 [Neopyropia yezoensis]
MVMEYMDGGCLTDVLSWAAGRVAAGVPAGSGGGGGGDGSVPVGSRSGSGGGSSSGGGGAVTAHPPPHRPGTPPGLPEPLIAYILAEVLAGLAALHRTGRIHRDVKSDNTLVATDGRVKVGDFGFAAEVPPGGARHTVVGTPFWMAPEVIRGDPYGAAADVWAAGILAIELADGAPPHLGLPPLRAMYLIAAAGAPAPSPATRGPATAAATATATAAAAAAAAATVAAAASDGGPGGPWIEDDGEGASSCKTWTTAPSSLAAPRPPPPPPPRAPPPPPPPRCCRRGRLVARLL